MSSVVVYSTKREPCLLCGKEDTHVHKTIVKRTISVEVA